MSSSALNMPESDVYHAGRIVIIDLLLMRMIPRHDLPVVSSDFDMAR